MAAVTMGEKFPLELVNEIFSKVKGHSAIARLCPSSPVSFTGNSEFVFNMDNDVSVVAEGAAKPDGGFTVAPVVMKPIKIVYQGRVSDEFMIASEERQLDMLAAFRDGMIKKVGQALDLIAFHGVDPKSNTKLASITGSFDALVTNIKQVGTGTNKYSDAVEGAIELCEEVNGIALGKALATGLASETKKDSGAEFAALKWGGNPQTLMGLNSDVNSTVSKAVKQSSDDAAAKVDEGIVGDWNALRWGFARDIMYKVIEYGNPDGGTYDLQQSNEVCLKAEAYIGFAIMDPAAFARITPAAG